MDSLITAAARALADLWPGGLTLVLPLADGASVPAALTGPERAALYRLAPIVGDLENLVAERRRDA